MTRAEIEQTIALFTAAGRRNIPVPISEWREYAMATKSIGKVDQKALAKGKIKPVDKAPVNVKAGRKPKADRQEAGLRANAAKARKGASFGPEGTAAEIAKQIRTRKGTP